MQWWVDHFAGLTLAELTPERIAEARDALASGIYTRAEEHKDEDRNDIAPKEYKRSGATVNRYLVTLSRLLTSQRRNGGCSIEILSGTFLNAKRPAGVFASSNTECRQRQVRRQLCKNQFSGTHCGFGANAKKASACQNRRSNRDQKR